MKFKKPKKTLKMIILIVFMIIGILLVNPVNIYAAPISEQLPSGEFGYVFDSDNVGDIHAGYADVPNHMIQGMTSFCQNHGEMTANGVQLPQDSISLDDGTDFSNRKSCPQNLVATFYYRHDDEILEGYDPETNLPQYTTVTHPLTSDQIESNENFKKVEQGIPKGDEGATYISYTPSERPKDLPNELAFIVSSGGSIKDIQDGIWQWLSKHPDYQEKNDAWGFGQLEGDLVSEVADAYGKFADFIKKAGGFSQTLEAKNYNKVTGGTSKKHIIESTENGIKKFTYTDTQIAVDTSDGEAIVLRTILC